jgi:hypothetical protein
MVVAPPVYSTETVVPVARAAASHIFENWAFIVS